MAIRSSFSLGVYSAALAPKKGAGKQERPQLDHIRSVLESIKSIQSKSAIAL
jgi:hypothetical protein